MDKIKILIAAMLVGTFMVVGYIGIPEPKESEILWVINGVPDVVCPNDTPPDVHAADKDAVAKLLTTVYRVNSKDAYWWSDTLVDVAVAHGVPVGHMVSMVATESMFRLDPKGRYDYVVGPAQINTRYWSDLGHDLYDPKGNLTAGAIILSKYKAQCGNWDCALKAYNVGITNYRKGKQKDAQERYLNKIHAKLAVASTFI